MMRGDERVADSGVSLATKRCQDCGNQAKKDCQHSRCRTCCKSRGFACQTHVNSTWVPVSLRYPRHHPMQQKQQISATVQDQEYHQPTTKRYRANQGSSSLGLQEGGFPVEARFPAAFRCVRVSSLDNTIDQYAYQASVSIGGHVFTGILYDQGPELEGTGNYVTGESSTSPGIALLQQENFVPGTTAAATGTSSSPYALPFCAFTPTTTQFFDQYPKS